MNFLYRLNEAIPPTHEFEAFAVPEAEGGFSVHATHYPGVVSQGETIDEAKSNIAEAFMAMLEACRQLGERMEYSSTPWADTPAGSQRLWIVVLSPGAGF